MGWFCLPRERDVPDDASVAEQSVAAEDGCALPRPLAGEGRGEGM